MYVFLLAGCEVVVSAFIITLGNFFCLKKNPEEEPEARLEMAASACEKEGLNHEEAASEDDDAEAKGKAAEAKGSAGEVDGEVKLENGV